MAYLSNKGGKVKSEGLIISTKNVFYVFPLAFLWKNIRVFYLGEISVNKPAMNHGDNSDHWAWHHGSIVKIGPEKMKSHIQCLI